MNKYQEYILSILTERELLEQFAEEASELAQAALKLIRAAGYSNNPTPVTKQEAEANLEEELHDVLAVASLLGIIGYDDDENPKWQRWAERLGMTKGDEARHDNESIAMNNKEAFINKVDELVNRAQLAINDWQCSGDLDCLEKAAAYLREALMLKE